jgi:hypothetical protein
MMSMLAKGVSAPPRRSVERHLLGAMAPEQMAWMALGVMAALLPVTLLLAVIDPRELNGVSVWAKPIKFQLSLSLHFATLALLVRVVTPQATARATLRAGFIAATAAALLEILYIVLQAARGRASHFNVDTPLEAALYQAMGVGAVVIVAVAMQLGFLILRQARPVAGPGLVHGAFLGLVLGGVATLVTAGVLGAGEIAGPGHWVGGVRSDSDGLPLFGWSRSGGDLRVPHFFATHLMQALPLIGLVADRWQKRRARWIVLAAAIAGIALIAATFLQALTGHPFPF